MVREAFQKDLCSCTVENGLSRAKCMEVRVVVILTPEPSRHF